MVVIDAEDGEVLNRIGLGEEDDDFIRATISIAYDSLFVRTNTTLFRIGS